MEVAVKGSVRSSDRLSIPPFRSALVVPQQQHGNPARIERVQHSERSAPVLDPQLPKATMARTANGGAVWKRKLRSQLLQHHDDRVDGLARPFVKTIPPLAELLCDLDESRPLSTPEYVLHNICCQGHIYAQETVLVRIDEEEGGRGGSTESELIRTGGTD